VNHHKPWYRKSKDKSPSTACRRWACWAASHGAPPIKAIVNSTVAPRSAATAGRRHTYLLSRSSQPGRRAAMGSPR
jgi:hypothetical protein